MPNPFDSSSIVEKFCEELILKGYLFINESEDLTLNNYFRKSILKYACESYSLRHALIDPLSIRNFSKELASSNTLVELVFSDENDLSDEDFSNLLFKDSKSIIWVPKNIPKVLEQDKEVLYLYNSEQKFIPKLTPEDKEVFLLEIIRAYIPDADHDFLHSIANKSQISELSIDHFICYSHLIKNISTESNEITTQTLKGLGQINENIENLGNAFERSFAIRFPNFSLESLMRLFLIKKNDDSISHVSLTIQKINENLDESTSIIEEIIEFIRSSSFILFTSSELISNKRLELNKSLLIHWSFYSNVTYKERLESNLYLQISKRANFYNKGSGKLLNQAQCIEASALLFSTSFNKKWASKYSNEFEQTKKFIELSMGYNKEYEVSQDRKRKKQIKRAKNTTLIVSAAFIVSMILALFSFSSLQKAEEATLIAVQNAERADKNANRAVEEELKANKARERAEQLADLSRKNEKRAEISRALAQKSAENARLSELQATKAKIQTEEALKDAIRSREVAEIERKKSEQQSKQEKARSLSLSALQLYANNQISAGLKLAKEAYELNTDNNGINTQPDILYALIKGHNLIFQKTFITESNVKTIRISNEEEYIGVLYVNDRLELFKIDKNLTFITPEIVLNNISSFSFHEANGLLYTEGNTLKSVRLENLKDLEVALTPITLLSENEPLKLCATKDIYLMSSKGVFNLKGNRLELVNSEESVMDFNNLTQLSDNQFVSFHSGKINFLENRNNRLLEKFSFSFQEKVVSISELFHENLLAIGFNDGTLRILNISEQKVVSENKVHRSKISTIRVTTIMNEIMLLTTSFDSEIKLFVADENSWKSGVYTAINNFSSHKTWITDSFLLNENQLATIDYDGILKLWNLNLNSILNANKN